MFLYCMIVLNSILTHVGLTSEKMSSLIRYLQEQERKNPLLFHTIMHGVNTRWEWSEERHERKRYWWRERRRERVREIMERKS